MKCKIILLILLSITLKLQGFDISVIDRDLEIPLEGVRIREADSGFETFTDFNGKASIDIGPNINRAIIIAELIGYEPSKQLITNFKESLEIGLLMEGVLEGQELVVEVEAIGETDEEVGVSTVIEKEIIQAAAKMGIIEDVMNAVKILPGVSYSGSFGSQMSVRGGDPSGLTAVMDGFVVKYPNHWGGAFSIFNPNIVESIKFSPGIFSVKHGQATSALLEVNTIDPTDGLKFSGVLSTSTIEGFSQIPLGKNDDFGILTGFRLTNYDLALQMVEFTGNTFGIQELVDTVEPISRAPYIYDFYLKTLYAPSQTFKWHLNGFWGNDGIGVENVEVGDKTVEISNAYEFFYTNTDFFINTGLQILPINNLLMNIVFGYEYWSYDLDAEIIEEGYQAYSDAFIATYPLLTAGSGGYEIYTESNYNEETTKQSIQGRYDIDWSINSDTLLQFGIGSTLDLTDNSGDGSLWIITGDTPEYKLLTFSSNVPNTKNILSFAYTNLNVNIIPGLLKMDLGVRTDHAYYIGEDDFTLNTYPEIAPRLNLVFSPTIGNNIFRDNVFSIGSGLFNKNPFGLLGPDKEFGLENFEMVAEKTLMSVIGWETQLPNDLRFKIEGYYKYIYDRFYFNTITNDDDEYETDLHFDGFGHVVGGDFILDKKVSRYLDGLFSYTYIYARYKEPEDNTNGDYYYPSFHRFNTLNLLLNYKPTGYFTFTTKLTFATGNPKNEYGETIMFPAYVLDSDGNTQVAEMYSRNSYYSDVLRSNYSLPLDIKFSWHNYFKNTKYEWEIYIAIQDVLAPVLGAIQPSDSTQTSKWSGDDEEAPSSGFSFPIPSIGFSMSF